MARKINGKPSNVAIVVVAAGIGARMGGDVPKQYHDLGGRAVMLRTLDALRVALPEAPIFLVVHSDYEQKARVLLGESDVTLVYGGATRAQSVFFGLQAIAKQKKKPDIVLVHDVARPFVSPEMVMRLLATLAAHPNAMVIPALSVSDSVKIVEGELVCGVVERDTLKLVQTPQVAAFPLLLAAHEAASKSSVLDVCTDDASVMASQGYHVVWVEGDVQNMKLTTPEDFTRASQIFAAHHAPRVGMGYDVHQFETHAATTPLGQQVIMLGGIAIPFERKLKGHSDADVVLHAVVDALLGAIGAGDIGLHFPPSDIKWRNADSAMFVAEAVRLMEERGGRLENLDVTYIGEVPKIGIYREAMQTRIAGLVGVSPQRVNVKATTTERLGFTGREEGAAAQAVALVMMPTHF